MGTTTDWLARDASAPPTKLSSEACVVELSCSPAECLCTCAFAASREPRVRISNDHSETNCVMYPPIYDPHNGLHNGFTRATPMQPEIWSGFRSDGHSPAPVAYRP
eukprot:5724617-Pyramimonas_sp.AAC.3